ncbi:Dam family site-specific DNA-(adenine-N6)-methyltransferase [Vibrio tubiashii]|uniref:Dam family site-specific DNA-(adenine-N6)-methyltransferase n=1 Tax=Vibrio tubiashii TaxID=29498 RepID=UPI001EFC6E87|nr:Dam family site-specific DNA-(adenine-N6)-methyltransferase [Vibrio tubiashii]MCG9584323.1 Dam family site-specific DNA-(adenine-N6)-methyltransferase [Vibrio tubiashii]MCG9618340.1 Dam family site-specific DNA-(adenine-N6)-methyltransferase [Vibrio tubiashii]MCG9685709.1 Dam family site-specific DNA-(adenine-N6)-methyltransferase [Vibrio tubiashii]
MKKQRAFLKWAGGKYRLIDDIAKRLPDATCLVEPFVGAGSVFLNTDFKKYVLADINPDLIELYKYLKRSPDEYVSEARKLFVEETNEKSKYLEIRQQFNESSCTQERAILFLYLNRFGYNGLCRYNQKGGFNVPFGSYKKPYFPEQELFYFAEKAQRATFKCQSYTKTIETAPKGSVVYCDPPYAPLSDTSNFTSYAKNGFSIEDQILLGDLARKKAKDSIQVLISNHATQQVEEWYKGADISKVKVNRYISSKGSSRHKVDELFALFK